MREAAHIKVVLRVVVGRVESFCKDPRRWDAAVGWRVGGKAEIAGFRHVDEEGEEVSGYVGVKKRNGLPLLNRLLFGDWQIVNGVLRYE